VYHRVTVRLSTHDAGGRVTAKDVELAARMEAILPVG
jgi:4a-hydroxytetrahydrobiopterin dehydratase